MIEEETRREMTEGDREKRGEMAEEKFVKSEERRGEKEERREIVTVIEIANLLPTLFQRSIFLLANSLIWIPGRPTSGTGKEEIATTGEIEMREKEDLTENIEALILLHLLLLPFIRLSLQRGDLREILLLPLLVQGGIEVDQDGWKGLITTAIL